MAGGKYKDTVILPDTKFPMRGDLARREPEILATWESTGLYGRIQESRKDAPLFVFHDGPPYTSGHIHYGHILNKILKDIVVKSRTLAGFQAPFVPGFDTHGLPIELHVERELGPKRSQLSQTEIRGACKAFATKYIGIQTAEFKRLGVLGQWDAPYVTLDPAYEAAVIRALAVFARGGYMYRGKKPVYWCPRDRTALAEAEIEYADKTSPSVYVRCPVATAAEGGVDPGALAPALAGKRLAYVIWTTTPWTLPANLAIVAHPASTYLAIPSPKDPGEYLVVVRELAEPFLAAIGGDPASLAAAVELPPATMATLEGTRYHHPFIATPRADAHYRLWFADYVTTEQGTGLVHTAPGHGADDYKTGMAHGLEPYAPLDDNGRYTGGVMLGDESLDGVSTDDANPKIVAHLAATGALLNPTTDKVHHSYPHCWRCKQPILFRATPQWFLAIDHAELRAKALEAIEHTEWVPKWGKERIHGMIANRPDWVLSRQRLWGVPIPVFYCRECKHEHAEAATMEHVAAIFGEQGADAWWSRSVAELVPAGVTCGGCGKPGAEVFEREKDILDVWFESGASWLAMRAKDAVTYGENPAGEPPIDLYLEGSDQHRGWFHSSLLIGVGVRGGAPYKSVITHGFVLDENGVPYSKSTILAAKAAGKKVSYIEPDDVIKKSGAEMFRLWVASTEFRNDIPYSQTILDGLADWYRKLRNTAKFLLGAVSDFDPGTAIDPDAARPVDRYMRGRVDDLVRRCTEAYARYDLHVVHRALVDFVTVDLSAVYSDVVKDRLYCDAVDAPARRAAQAVMYDALRAVTTLAAPILCFTMEDVWSYLPRRAGDPDSVHIARFPDAVAAGAVDAALATDFAVLLDVREAATKALEPFRAAKHKSVDAALTIAAPPAEHAVLARYADQLADLLIVSSVELAEAPVRAITVAEHAGPRCERCYKHYAELAPEWGELCRRCTDALLARGLAPGTMP